MRFGNDEDDKIWLLGLYLNTTDYRAMLASAERGDATVSRLSVCLSVRP